MLRKQFFFVCGNNNIVEGQKQQQEQCGVPAAWSILNNENRFKIFQLLFWVKKSLNYNLTLAIIVCCLKRHLIVIDVAVCIKCDIYLTNNTL